MKKILFVLIISFTVLYTNAQTASQHYQLTGKNYTEVNNYYLLNLLQNYTPANKLLSNDAVLTGLVQAKIKALKDSVKANKSFGSIIKPLKFTDQEIKIAGDRLAALYKPGNALGLLVKDHLIPSGTYLKYDSLPAALMLVKAWEQDARAVNYTISVYAEGKRPNYPDVDSINFNVYGKTYQKVIADGANGIIRLYGSTKLFFLPSVNYALHSLDVNGRNDAGSDEPLTQTANKKAYDRIKTINWSKYTYTLIWYPARGPISPEYLSARAV